MTDVYVVQRNDWGTAAALGVYASLELAQAAWPADNWTQSPQTEVWYGTTTDEDGDPTDVLICRRRVQE